MPQTPSPEPDFMPDGLRATELTRDERIKVKAARVFGHTYAEISKAFWVHPKTSPEGRKGP
jgi:hypothetical protein